MNKAKNQHSVSDFYFKYFATPETKGSKSPQIWALDKEQGDPILTPTKDAAVRRYLYSPRDSLGQRRFDMEQKLEKVESLLGRIWPILADGFIEFSDEVKKGLGLFLATLYLRHPSQIDLQRNIHEQLLHLFDSMPQDANGRPAVSEFLMNGKNYPLDNSGWDKWRKAEAEDHKHSFVRAIEAHAHLLATHMLQRRWSVVFSEKPVFITSDKPVLLLHSKRERFGVATPGVRIFFPFSPTRVLVIDDLKEQDGLYYPLKEGTAACWNSLIWRNAEKFMYSPRHPDEICSEIVGFAERSQG